MDAINGYRIMWVFVLYDLPTTTKKEIKAAQQFRKMLDRDGFAGMQFSCYIRHCASMENAEVHKKRVVANLPETGKICIFTLTDKQYENIQFYYGTKVKPQKNTPIQLEIF